MEQRELLPTTDHPLVLRTDFENDSAWQAICNLIGQPVHDVLADEDFYAYVDFLDNPSFRDLTEQDLLARVPSEYCHSFIFVVDKTATQSPEFPILVMDLGDERGRTFRAIPSEIQGIENNLSISNMDFSEFAESVDGDGVFRGFRDPC